MDKNAGKLEKIMPVNMREFREKSAEVYGKLKPELERNITGLSSP